VTFTTSSTACSIAGNTVTLISLGSCSITAHQAGNASFDAAPDVTRPFNINKADQTITFNPLPDHVITDPPFNVSASASSGLPVTFTTHSPQCSITGATVTLLSLGTCDVEAHQSGNADFNPAPVIIRTFNINAVNRVYLPLVLR
jgi:hypothetical protein